jgi:thioredoxin 1
MVFRDGIRIFNQAGALPAPAFEDLIKQVKTVDMADVQKQIAEEQS